MYSIKNYIYGSSEENREAISSNNTQINDKLTSFEDSITRLPVFNNSDLSTPLLSTSDAIDELNKINNHTQLNEPLIESETTSEQSCSSTISSTKLFPTTTTTATTATATTSTTGKNLKELITSHTKINNSNSNHRSSFSKFLKRVKDQAEGRYCIGEDDDDEEEEGVIIQNYPSSSKTRILDRSGSHYQSRGKFNGILRHGNINHASVMTTLCEDWFHTWLYLPTLYLFLLLGLLFSTVVFVFALIYDTIAHSPPNATEKCGLDVQEFVGALYFSLSTMVGVNYDASSHYNSKKCWGLFLLIMIQTFISLIFTAVVVGLAFFRLSNATKRSRSIIFSNIALIRKIKHDLYFVFRVAELREHFLMDATVRIYCIRHDRLPIKVRTNGNIEQQIQTFHFQVYPMKLHYPNQDGNLLMALPTVIAHKIEESSPIMPPPIWFDAQGWAHRCPNDASININQQDQEQQITFFLKDREVEFIVCIDGVDEISGAPLQARHSYKWDELLWNHHFVPCVTKRSAASVRAYGGKNNCVIDFQKFHRVIPTDFHSDYDPISSC